MRTSLMKLSAAALFVGATFVSSGTIIRAESCSYLDYCQDDGNFCRDLGGSFQIDEIDMSSDIAWFTCDLGNNQWHGACCMGL